MTNLRLVMYRRLSTIDIDLTSAFSLMMATLASESKLSRQCTVCVRTYADVKIGNRLLSSLRCHNDCRWETKDDRFSSDSRLSHQHQDHLPNSLGSNIGRITGISAFSVSSANTIFTILGIGFRLFCNNCVCEYAMTCDD